MRRGADAVRRFRCVGSVVGIALLSIVSTAGTIAAPVLVDGHSLLLVALSPRLLHLTVAAGEVPFGTFFVVAVARLAVADPLHFLLGRRFGTRLEVGVRRRSPRAAAALEDARAVVARAGLLAILVRPVGSVLAAAGACRLRPVPTALADLVGTAVHVVLVYQGGRLLLPLTAGLPYPVLLAGSSAVAIGVAMATARVRLRKVAARGAG